MKAVVQSRYGSVQNLEVREVPAPRPGPGEVLVRVRAASLHPDVWHVVAGRPLVLRLMGAGFLRPKQPIPGTDMAGVVEEVGPGSTRFRPGEAVFGETVESSWANGGAFAELVAVPQDWLAAKPENVSFEEAASVPSSGFITLRNLPGIEDWPPGHRVLINGAGGGVGSLALQIAKAHGAHVTAVDATGKLDLLRSLGADEVIDYTREDVVRRGERYDLVFDVPGTRPVSHFEPVLTTGGRYVPIGHESYGRDGRRVLGLLPHFLWLSFRSRPRRLRGRGVASRPSRDQIIASLRDGLAAGRITPPIDRVYPLDQVREAMRHLMDDELRGKVLLSIP